MIGQLEGLYTASLSVYTLVSFLEPTLGTLKLLLCTVVNIFVICVHTKLAV